MSQYTVYILRTSANTLYTGQTIDIKARLCQHFQKKGAKYLRRFSSFTLVYTEKCPTKSSALKREAEIKKLSKSQKEALVNKTETAPY